MGYKGHYGEYSGNAKWSKNHADTEVTKSNYKASERDDAAHIDYLKRDVDYDNKHGHSDSSMTNDEKHISKLAGDMKYDKQHHGSPAKGKAVYVGGTVNYGSGDTTREFGTSGGNRRSVEVKSNLNGDGQATKTVHKLNKKTNEVESKTRNISNRRAARIEDRKYKRFRKAGAEGVNDMLTTVNSNSYVEPTSPATNKFTTTVRRKRYEEGDAPGKMVSPLNDKVAIKGSFKTQGEHRMTTTGFEDHVEKVHSRYEDAVDRVKSNKKGETNSPGKMVSPLNDKSSRYLSEDDITRKFNKVDKKLRKVNANNSDRKNTRKLNAADKTLKQIESNTKETIKIKKHKAKIKTYGDNMFTTLKRN